MSTILSTWAVTPIQFTDTLNDSAWADPGQMTIPGGYLVAKNDGQFLYAALDLVDDTGNDAATEDYFWFTFDRNRDASITPNNDVNYGLYPGFPDKMGRQYYLSPGTWTGLVNEISQSACKVAFETSPNSGTAHRIWKLKFKLTDLSVSLLPFWLSAPFTKFGIKVRSFTPSFDNYTPATFTTSFADLHTLYFSRKPSISAALLGPVMGSVGLIPTTKINTVTGKATTDAGYYTFVQNAAFGGLLNIIGNRTTLQALFTAGALKYKILHRDGTSGAFTPFRSAWYNYRWNGSDYVLESFGPDVSNNYPMTSPAVDYSIDDLLVQFDSNSLSKGLHQFQVQFFNGANLLMPSAAQTVTIFIDNNVPEVKINSIKHSGVNVDACAIVNLSGDFDGLVFNITANDPEGNLLSYALSAGWGNGSGETIITDSYTLAKGASWNGVQNLVVPSSGMWVPDQTCAYGFTVSAWARTTNGYGYLGYNSVSKYITLIKPGGSPVAERVVMPKGHTEIS